MRRVLEVTLKSDLCVGSGYSYAGVVDSDSCFDRYGIPYIPARRLKGCLLEAAQMLGYSAERLKIFGEWGQDFMNRTPLKISDAYMGGYASAAEALESIGSLPAAGEFFSPDQIRDCFSRVKAQTAIDKNGVADGNSLRFIRTVNRYGLSGNEQQFFAEIQLPDGDGKAQELLANAAMALRHIGEDRNRGLGNVQCRLLSEKESEERLKTESSREAEAATEQVEIENKEYLEKNPSASAVLSYTIKTRTPVMISMADDQNSESFINGQSVLGYFADAYLQKNGYRADDTFERLFLKGGLRFSPLYPASSDGEVCFPAPAWLAKLKKSGEIVNISLAELPGRTDSKYGENVKGGRYFPGSGNQPKKLKGKYAAFIGGKADIRETQTEIIYHHRHESAAAEEQLYAQNAIAPGQSFAGTVTGKAADVKIIAEFLRRGSMHLGKSRSAQYGACQVIRMKAGDANPASEAVAVHKGERLLAMLRSDGLFLDAAGNYTVRTAEIRKQIRESLNDSIKDRTGGGKEKEFLAESDGFYAEIEVGRLSGYYGKWNLRRASVPCVCAGTTFEYEAACDFVLPQGLLSVGVRRGEGFGMLEAIKKPESWLIPKVKTAVRADAQEWEMPAAICHIYRRTLQEKLFREMEKKALGVKKSALTASAVGRVTLMLTECVNECRAMGAGERIPRIREKLDEKIASMKDKEKQKAAGEFLEKYYDRALDKVILNEAGKPETYDRALGRIADEKIRREIEAECRLYCLEQALVLLKYKTKEEN